MFNVSLRPLLLWDLLGAAAACGDVFIVETEETQCAQFMVLMWRNVILSCLSHPVPVQATVFHNMRGAAAGPLVLSCIHTDRPRHEDYVRNLRLIVLRKFSVEFYATRYSETRTAVLK